MRVRPQYVQQPRSHTRPVAVLMLMLVAVGAMVMAMAVPRAMAMAMAALMPVMRVAARNVHAIQNAAKNAFPHVTSNKQMQFGRNNE